MSTIPFPDHKEIARKAAEWLAALDRGLDEQEEQALHTWLEQRHEHAEALVKYASMWDLFDVLNPIADILPIENYADETRIQHAVSTVVAKQQTGAEQADQGIANMADNKTIRQYNYAIASSVVLMAVLLSSWLVFLKQPDVPPIVAQHYKTKVGEQSSVSLADGSQLKLNTNSHISVLYSDQQRKVELLQGEVYFDVAKNPQRPFVVHTAYDQVTAIGTAFNIKLNNGSGTEVVVTEGKVKIDSLRPALDGKTNTSQQAKNYAPVYLSQGEKVLIHQHEAQVSYEQNLDSALAWRDGMLIFEGQTLNYVINEIGRYTPLSFKIVDKEIESIPVGGFFRTGDLEQLLGVLEQNFGIHHQRKGNQIMLSRQFK